MVRTLSDAIIVAIIAGLCSVVGQWLISHQADQKRKEEQAVKDALQEEKLGRIENQLRIHNSYAERFSEIQTDIAVIKNELKNMKGA